MLDQMIRARIGPGLDRAAGRIESAGVSAASLTATGLAAGAGACVAAAIGAWGAALALWLANRTLDGLDGPLARRRGATELGGLLDFVADFVVYAGFVAGVAIDQPRARLACVALLAAYLVNNVALLSLSSVAERLGLAPSDERSLRLTTGLAEGGETIVAYVAFCLWPGAAPTIAWAFAGLVGLTAVQRVVQAVITLRAPAGTEAQARSASRHSDA